MTIRLALPFSQLNQEECHTSGSDNIIVNLMQKLHNLNILIQGKTRIVRGSDYSPASELFARLRKTMTCNNPKLDLVNFDAHKRLVSFCQFVFKVLSGNKILTSIKGQKSVKSLQKMTGNNRKLDHDHVNVDVHTNFGQILSICSQYIERKRNSDVNHGP